MENGSRTRSDCPNASNPFHVCSHYCSQSSPHGASTKPPSRIEGLRSAMGVVKGKKRGSGDGLKVLGEARDVDPRCVNASNPFHKCADYCSQNMPHSFKGSPRVLTIEKGKEVAKTGQGDQRKVDPRCVNASNPFHECADYCLHKTNSSEQRTHQGKSVVFMNGSKDGVKMSMRSDVHPNCVNANNPFHKCADYCSQRINQAV
ncbi:mRNA splicing factor SYF2 protein [Dioscorea alata]|uniref:mRNA splicing factor SYF2 protein n=1 Tax=Dioscorea alata TaxID=55571 RepID=A0ACB7V5P6_DIOAL|nr:mRNA splicing factor SYF2 protein [Dioscorea alata]